MSDAEVIELYRAALSRHAAFMDFILVCWILLMITFFVAVGWIMWPYIRPRRRL